MAGKQPAAGMLSLADVEEMLASSGVTKAAKTKFMAQATKMAKASEPQTDPLKAKKEAALASAASFARPAVSRAFEPCCLEPARSWALSDALTTVLKDVVAVCPNEAASRGLLNSALNGFYGGASATAMRKYEALVNTTHNQQLGLLSTLPPEVLERIMMHVPPELVVGRTCVSSLSSAMACKALAQACTVNTALIELTWTIDNFLMLGDDRIFGPDDGVEILGRQWQIIVRPKGEGAGKEWYRMIATISVPLSAPAISVSIDHAWDARSGRGKNNFIPLANMTAPTKTILQNGSLTIKVTGRIWHVARQRKAKPLKA